MFGFMKRMNKNGKRILFFLLLFCLIYSLWGIAQFYAGYIEEHYASVSIRLKSAPISGHVLLQADKNEVQEGNEGRMTMTAWNSFEKEELECKELSTLAKADRIEVFGDTRRAYPIELVYGNVVATDDYDGCLIDEATAYELYHTGNAVGNLLTNKNQQYCIRGIIKSSDPILITVTREGSRTFSNLELTFVDQENAMQLAEEFLRRYGLAERYTVIDGYLFARGLLTIVRLPAWLLGFFLIYDLLSILYRRRRYPFLMVSLLFLLVLLWPLLSWMMEFKVFIPEQLIPTKWSDFTFWSDRMYDLKDWMKEFSHSMPHHRDLMLKQYVGLSLLCAAAATIGMVAIILHERMLYLGSYKAVSFISIGLLEIGVIYLLFVTGKIFQLPRAYHGMPIFYMIARDCFCWCRIKIFVLLEVRLLDHDLSRKDIRT